MVRFLMG